MPTNPETRTPAPCFAALDRAELAHVARCQHTARDLALSVVSSGVFAAEAGELAGLHFWLVANPARPTAPALVWLSVRRLLCACKRRRSDGALTCCHAQTVRLWLLAAAGVAVPSGGVSSPAPVAEIAPEPAPEQLEPITEPTPVAEDIITVPCPVCGGEVSPVILADWGMCPDCLDDIAEAENKPRPSRTQICTGCRVHVAIAEMANGSFCRACVEKLERHYGPVTPEYANHTLAASLP